MANFKAVVRKKRADGFYPVYIRIVHRSRMGYIKTSKIVTDKQLSVSIPSTPFFYIKKALADKQNQLKPLLITQRKSFCNCREATSRSPLRSDRLGGAVRFP